MLSCSCNYDDDDAEWYYYPPNDFSELKTARARRCVSCKALVSVGAKCLKFSRERCAKTDVEYKIYGDGPNISMAAWYLCESCGEIYLNLEAIGYCIYPASSMTEALAEYWQLSGFDPNFYKASEVA